MIVFFLNLGSRSLWMKIKIKWFINLTEIEGGLGALSQRNVGKIYSELFYSGLTSTKTFLHRTKSFFLISWIELIIKQIYNQQGRGAEGLSLNTWLPTFCMLRTNKGSTRITPPWGRRGFKSRIRPLYPQRVVKGD